MVIGIFMFYCASHWNVNVVLYHDESDSVDSTKLDGMCDILLLGHCWNKAFRGNRRAEPTRVYARLVPPSMGTSFVRQRSLCAVYGRIRNENALLFVRQAAVRVVRCMRHGCYTTHLMFAVLHTDLLRSIIYM